MSQKVGSTEFAPKKGGEMMHHIGATSTAQMEGNQDKRFD